MLVSCLKRNEFPDKPDIEFISFRLDPQPWASSDSIGVVKFSFTDGDGDLGLDPNELSGVYALSEPYYYNLFIRHFQKQNGEYVELMIPDTAPLQMHARFKSLTPTAGDKTLEGEMDVGIGIEFIGTPYDTVRYEMYIVDRSLKHSDTLVTPDIILSQ